MLRRLSKTCSMKTILGIVAMTLLAAVVAIFPGALLPPLPETYAGCPEHRQPVPAPSQHSSHHECCQAGHQPAIVCEVASFRFSLLSLEAPADTGQPFFSERLFDYSKIGPAFPDKPPSAVPLRI